jgi:hypothetical protein
MSMFVIANKELFPFNSQVHNCSTRTIYDLHYPQTNLAQFQKGICYMGIKIFNHLPTNIKSMLKDLRSFKLQLTFIDNIFIAKFFLYMWWIFLQISLLKKGQQCNKQH